MAVVPLAAVLTVVPNLVLSPAQATHLVRPSITTRDELVSPVVRLARFDSEQSRKEAHDARVLVVEATHLKAIAYWGLVHDAALRAAEAAARPRPPAPPPQAVSAPLSAPQSVSFGGLAGVVACIKAHESGNYSESSHIYDGSGAYQMIPHTWAYYSTLAGYGTITVVNGRTQYNPTWSYEYEAPPSVQDAALMYALTHGGAGNWSMRYGNDPCTAGLPGGG